MKILAVDQSYTSCGIILFDNGCIVDAKRVVSTKADEEDIFERAWQVTTEIAKIAQTNQVDLIAMEGLAFSKIGNATRDLAGLQFTINTYLRFTCMFKTHIFSPNTVKKTATGKGNAKKEQMYDALPQEVKNRFELMNLKKTTGRYDLTDAYWIGISAVNWSEEEKKKTKVL
jgi:Holliday junction resolvasome RuvABC endonuclease subunit